MVASTDRPSPRIDFAPEGEAEASIDDELLEQLVDSRRRRLPGPRESAVRDDYARRWLRTNRSAFWIGMVLYLSLAALDIYAAPESAGQILLIRTGSTRDRWSPG